MERARPVPRARCWPRMAAPSSVFSCAVCSSRRWRTRGLCRTRCGIAASRAFVCLRSRARSRGGATACCRATPRPRRIPTRPPRGPCRPRCRRARCSWVWRAAAAAAGRRCTGPRSISYPRLTTLSTWAYWDRGTTDRG